MENAKNKPWFLRVCKPLENTAGKGEITHNENFSFSYCLFYLFGQALVFTRLQNKPLENTAGKGEIAHNEQFLLFLLSFLHVWRTFCYFHQLKNCHFQTLSVWRVTNLSFWKGLRKPCLAHHK